MSLLRSVRHFVKALGGKVARPAMCRSKVTTRTGAILPEPQKGGGALVYGGLAVTVYVGIGLGAKLSERLAALLEEYELFVPDDDNDD